MDVFGLKNYIIGNPELIELILEKSGFHKIKRHNDEYRCAKDTDSNPTAVKVNIKNLSSSIFSSNLKGDLITLIQGKSGLSFTKTLNYIADIVQYKNTDIPESKITLPFGGYYKKISRMKNDNALDIETYTDEILDQFEILPNMLFYEDGILPQIQEKFKIGYDSLSCRITVPWYSFDGRLCGVMGRLNRRNTHPDESKWYPVIPFPKSKTLYGYAANYQSIQEKGIVLIGESEKHTLLLASKGLNVGIGLGGCNLSELQSNHIKAMFPQKAIIMLDEGLDEEQSYELAVKLKSDRFYRNQVGYIYDSNNMYLPKESKLAPADVDVNTLKLLIKNCTRWI
ncbi:hypothetical protein A616_16715 [Brevibacillus brevis X23]|nr:hypothetical protein A616_16715 [Brevibacillus brevis X23]